METRTIATYKRVSLSGLIRTAREYFAMLLRRWYVITIAAFLGALVGASVAYLQPPKFEARLSFALEEGQSGGLAGALNIAAMLGIDLGSSGNIFSGDNILAIMSSREMLERVLLTVDSSSSSGQETLANEWMRITKAFKGNARLSKISFPPGLQRAQFSYLQDSILFTLQTGISNNNLAIVRPDKKLNIYVVNFTAPEERYAKIFVETLVQKTIAFYTDLKSKRSLQTLQILEGRVAVLKGATFSSIDRQQTAKDININPAFARANGPVAKNQLDITAYGTAYAELFKNLEIARMQYLKDIPLLQIIDPPRYPMRNLKRGRLRTGLVFAVLAAVLSSLTLSARFYIKREKMEFDIS